MKTKKNRCRRCGGAGKYYASRSDMLDNHLTDCEQCKNRVSYDELPEDDEEDRNR